MPTSPSTPSLAPHARMPASQPLSSPPLAACHRSALLRSDLRADHTCRHAWRRCAHTLARPFEGRFGWIQGLYRHASVTLVKCGVKLVLEIGVAEWHWRGLNLRQPELATSGLNLRGCINDFRHQLQATANNPHSNNNPQQQQQRQQQQQQHTTTATTSAPTTVAKGHKIDMPASAAKKKRYYAVIKLTDDRSHMVTPRFSTSIIEPCEVDASP